MMQPSEYILLLYDQDNWASAPHTAVTILDISHRLTIQYFEHPFDADTTVPACLKKETKAGEH